MPSLFRFLFTLAILGGIVYGGMFALALMVEPETREFSVRVPSSKLDPQRILPPRPEPVVEESGAADGEDGTVVEELPE